MINEKIEKKDKINKKKINKKNKINHISILKNFQIE